MTLLVTKKDGNWVCLENGEIIRRQGQKVSYNSVVTAEVCFFCVLYIVFTRPPSKPVTPAGVTSWTNDWFINRLTVKGNFWSIKIKQSDNNSYFLCIWTWFGLELDFIFRSGSICINTLTVCYHRINDDKTEWQVFWGWDYFDFKKKHTKVLSRFEVVVSYSLLFI